MVQTKLIKTIDEETNTYHLETFQVRRIRMRLDYSLSVLMAQIQELILTLSTNFVATVNPNSTPPLCQRKPTHIGKINVQKISFVIQLQKHLTGASVTTAETNLPWYSIYKPGGTAIITDNLINSRKTQSGEDNHGLGRWSFITL